MFPKETNSLKRSGALQLIYQGVFLHYASLWGPLRTSKSAREIDTRWLYHAIKRWFTEYGGNVALLIVIQLLILSTPLFSSHWLATTISSLAIPPFLTVLQMFLDNTRRDSRVYFDSDSKTGLTVKAYTNESGVVVWSYYNHFALPIGARNGSNIRAEIHRQAKMNKTIVTCTAQNEIIANFYLRSNPNGENLGGARPLMVWNYSTSPWNERSVNFLQAIFGVHSVRNTGQLPLGGKNMKNHLLIA